MLTRAIARRSGNWQFAEDCVGEAVLRLWCELRGGAEIDNYGAWLRVVATRVCLDAARKASRWPTCDLEMFVEDDATEERTRWLVSDELTPEEQAERAEFIGAVMDAIQQVPPTQYQALALRCCFNLNSADIAMVTGNTQQGAESLLFRGRRTMRQAMKEAGYDN